MQTRGHEFTTTSLPEAVGKLFEANNFRVQYGVKIHGAEIDIVARSMTDQFAPDVYVEVTIEYVGNTKYGKDLTKFSLIREISPSATCLSISAVGFTPDVKERAQRTRISTMTYGELFKSFEKFHPYADIVLRSDENIEFNGTYEEPLLQDDHGEHIATSWLSQWRFTTDDAQKWLIILGDYGTGKTSLTRVLQYRWVLDYQKNAEAPIPIRIELRNFSRQFDARTLLHHFLDSNSLGHVPIEFVFQLIRSGRVVLLLDGYDEMAQFLNPRERRACLSALAELAREGARGLLTSRPNYFSESEELRVFDSLYSTLEQNRYYLSRADRSYLDNERAIDNLVERYVLERYERNLRDLTEDQTEALVRRKLVGDPNGQRIVLHLLRRIFRVDAAGDRVSLSGKPVIIAYLLELIDDLKSQDTNNYAENLTEWQIYRMIVDRLMMRDQQRSPLDPERRRQALQRLSIVLSSKGAGVATEDMLYEVVDREFQRDLKLMSAEDRRHRRDELFEDIRSSATLTRAEGSSGGGWLFSHNSLREFLAVERFVRTLLMKEPVKLAVPVTDAMRAFAGSMPDELKREVVDALKEIWKARYSYTELGGYVGLFWRMLISMSETPSAFVREIFGTVANRQLDFGNIRLVQIKFTDEVGDWLEIDGSSSEISECEFRNVKMARSKLQSAILDSVIFSNVDLAGADFSNTWMVDCDFDDVSFEGAIFRGFSLDSRILVASHDGFRIALSGKSAVGFLQSRGALVDPVEDYYVYEHHPKFMIVKKICERISSQRNSQLRGLTQRGEAEKDPPFARSFVDYLKSRGLISINKNDLVSATPEGRRVLTLMSDHAEIDRELQDFFRESMVF